MREDIRAQLEQLAEPEYGAFSAALIPNGPPMLGVRLPKLRALAKQLAPEAEQLLAAPCDALFEDIMLRGMLIGCMTCSTQRRLQEIADFVPLIDNWSVCDSFCAGLKEAKRRPQEYWDFILPYLHSKTEFSVRFAVVMLLDYFSKGVWLPRTLEQLQAVTHDGYYVKMAVGWAISVCYIHDPVLTWDWMQAIRLDGQTRRIAIQKCLDSRRVRGADRERLRAMRDTYTEQ